MRKLVLFATSLPASSGLPVRFLRFLGHPNSCFKLLLTLYLLCSTALASVTVVDGVSYSAVNSSLRLYRVYYPTGTKNTDRLPIVVWIHGGSWYEGGRADGGTTPASCGNDNTIACWLGDHGYVVYSIDYTLVKKIVAATDLKIGTPNTTVSATSHAFTASDIGAAVVLEPASKGVWKFGGYKVVSVSGGSATLNGSPGPSGTSAGNYTVITGSTLWPVQWQDCSCFLSYLAENAGINVPGDPNDIFLMGNSAGGHLAGILGLAGNKTFATNCDHSSVNFTVRGVMAASPPTDLASLSAISAGFVSSGRNLLGCQIGYGSCNAISTTASIPTYVAQNLPPYIAFSGASDTTIPPSDAQLTQTAFAALVPPVNSPWIEFPAPYGHPLDAIYYPSCSLGNEPSPCGSAGAFFQQSLAFMQPLQGPKTIMKIASGDVQTSGTGQPFATPLNVTVLDSGGLPLAGASVVFTVTAGASGASGSFGSSGSVVTGANGVAAAPALTANAVAGQFTVTAATTGLSVLFTLKNAAPQYRLGAAALSVGPGGGTGAVAVTAWPAGASWTAASNAAWLQAGAGSGTGSGVVSYSAQANTGAVRTATLTIAGQTVTVTQAGSVFGAGSAVASLFSTGASVVAGVAVDGPRNVYFVDKANAAVKQWNAGTGLVTTLVGTGLWSPAGVAVDGLGNVYFADAGQNAVWKWSTGVGLTNVATVGLSLPSGVGVDGAGNVYILDSGNGALKQWNAATGQVTTLATGLGSAQGLAVDVAGNVYIADTGNNAIQQWNAAAQSMTGLITSGLIGPTAVAVDAPGNLYITGASNAIQQWTASSRQLTTLLVGVNGAQGVAVDGQGEVYVADSTTSTVRELISGFAGPGALNEGAAAGTDTVQVVPGWAAAAAAGGSDQSWLTVTGPGSSGVNFSFTANGSIAARTGHVTVLGQAVTVTQSGDTPAQVAVTAGAGQTAGVGQTFAVPLQVTVTDASGAPVQGASVTFTVIPGASGAGASFAPPTTVTTGANGVATATALTANMVPGAFTATAAVSGLTATFSLTNTAPAPTIVPAAGTPQSAKIQTTFAAQMQALVSDASGHPISGASVTFTAPTALPSGAFFGGQKVFTTTTNAQGIAIARPFAAGGTAGSYTVTASTAGVSAPAAFALTNTN